MVIPIRGLTKKPDYLLVYLFLKNNKYPPSLLYMCMTIGPSTLFLGFVNNVKNKLAKAIIVYGGVPFFHYILHFFLIHFLGMLLFLTREHTFSDGLNLPPNDDQRFVLPGEGYSLVVDYLIWILIILVTNPFCKWYDKYKTSHKEKWWLSYI